MPLYPKLKGGTFCPHTSVKFNGASERNSRIRTSGSSMTSALRRHELLEYATQARTSVRRARPIRMASVNASVVLFVMDKTRNEQVGRHVHRHAITAVEIDFHVRVLHKLQRQ